MTRTRPTTVTAVSKRSSTSRQLTLLDRAMHDLEILNEAQQRELTRRRRTLKVIDVAAHKRTISSVSARVRTLRKIQAIESLARDADFLTHSMGSIPPDIRKAVKRAIVLLEDTFQ
jgi:hypothetical protein